MHSNDLWFFCDFMFNPGRWHTCQHFGQITLLITMAYYSASSLTQSRSQPLSNSSRKHLNTTLHSSQSLTGRPSIMTYRNTQYPSATAALDAYISDFENQNPSIIYHRTVEDLLSPRSLLQMTVQRSLETGIRDTREEERRYNMKKMLDESYHQIMRADIEMQKGRDLWLVRSQNIGSYFCQTSFVLN